MLTAHNQTTINNEVSCSGVGLHGGRKVNITLRPAQADSGIVFARKTADGTRFISPCPEAVTSTQLATTIACGQDRLQTVEHLLAALRGLEIDNIMIEVDADEIPIMDGSAASFVFILREAGIRTLAKPRRALALKKPITFEKDGKVIHAQPSNSFVVDYTIDFKHPLVGQQRMTYEASPRNFSRDIAKARTFGFFRDVEMLQSMGLALGGSLDNAVVLDEFGVINPDGLRFPDEFVRHKVLDFVGDMAVAGLPLLGRFEVKFSGHAFNNAFLRYLVANSEDYLEQVVMDGAPVRPAEAFQPQNAAAAAMA